MAPSKTQIPEVWCCRFAELLNCCDRKKQSKVQNQENESFLVKVMIKPDVRLHCCALSIKSHRTRLAVKWMCFVLLRPGGKQPARRPSVGAVVSACPTALARWLRGASNTDVTDQQACTVTK